MKALVIIFSLFLLVLIGYSFYRDSEKQKTEIVNHADTIDILPAISVLIDTAGCHALRKKNDSLQTQLFLAQFKIARVQKYLNICLRNASQDKFLKGWIKRAIQ